MFENVKKYSVLKFNIYFCCIKLDFTFFKGRGRVLFTFGFVGFRILFGIV